MQLDVLKVFNRLSKKGGRGAKSRIVNDALRKLFNEQGSTLMFKIILTNHCIINMICVTDLAAPLLRECVPGRDDFFIRRKIMVRIAHSVKPSKTVDEQLNIIKCRGLVVVDDNEAKEILKSISYYRLTAYALSLLANFKRFSGNLRMFS